MKPVEQFLYFLTFLLLGIIFLGSLQFLKMFIKSRPPGRKLVGADAITIITSLGLRIALLTSLSREME